VQDKFLQFLGLAQRAGVIKSGAENCLHALRKGQVSLLIVASDTEPKAVDVYLALAEGRGIPRIFCSSQAELGRALGKSRRAVVAVTDFSFSRRLIELGSNNGGAL